MQPPVTTGRPYLRHFGADHGHGVHDFLMEELELGEAIAMALDDEACGFGPLFDFMFALTSSINNVLAVAFTFPHLVVAGEDLCEGAYDAPVA